MAENKQAVLEFEAKESIASMEVATKIAGYQRLLKAILMFGVMGFVNAIVGTHLAFVYTLPLLVLGAAIVGYVSEKFTPFFLATLLCSAFGAFAWAQSDILFAARSMVSGHFFDFSYFGAAVAVSLMGWLAARAISSKKLRMKTSRSWIAVATACLLMVGCLSEFYALGSPTTWLTARRTAETYMQKYDDGLLMTVPVAVQCETLSPSTANVVFEFRISTDSDFVARTVVRTKGNRVIYDQYERFSRP